jgi:hypothetical protein
MKVLQVVVLHFAGEKPLDPGLHGRRTAARATHEHQLTALKCQIQRLPPGTGRV